MISAWPVPTQTAETFLVRREGEEVRFLTPLRHEADTALRKRLSLASPELPAAQAAQGQAGILPEARDYRNEPVLAYITAIAGSPWVMIAKIDQREAQAGIRKTAGISALILGLILLMTYSLAYAGWRRILEQALIKTREASARLESERRWKLALDGAGHGVWDWHIATGRADYSPMWKTMLGYDEADIVDSLSAWEQLVHPEDLARVKATMHAHLAGESARYECLLRMRCQDGTWKWLLDRGTVLERDAAGQPQRVLGTHTDITAQMEAEEALSASEERFRYAMEAANDGIWDWNLHSDQVYFSPGWGRMLGYAAEELAAEASTWADLLHPEERDQVLARTRRLLADPGHYELEFRLRTQAGDYRWVLIRAKVVEWGSDGAPWRAVGTHVDVTELKAAQARAEQATRAKSEFLAHMSHEIRTPMNAVLGQTQLLGRQPLSPEQLTMVQRIQDAGQSLLGIINDILDFSKIEAGQLQLSPRPFRLETLTAKLASLFGATAAAKGLGLLIAPPPASPGPLWGDALRLEQVLINLTGNAIKFTDRGEVALCIHPLASTDQEVRLRFEVQDTGIGISPEVQATLFTPFTQADAGISRRFGGTGLGLSISKRLVDLMSGVIGVDSQPGQGSTFWFEVTFLRTSEVEEISPAAPVATPTGPRLRGLRLLVVDDSAMNRDLVEQALALEGAKVTLAADGQQAVQYLQSTTPGFDAILMDVRMPIMDGLTAMRLIRRELGLSDLPILAFTAGVLPAEQQAARDAGANEVLAKPLNLDLLAMRLAHHVGAERLAAAAEVGPGGEGVTPTSSATPPLAVPLAAEEGEVRVIRDASGPGDFPAIPGIDRHSLALTLGPNRAFFLRMLGRFLAGSPALLVHARQALTQGDRETAARFLHSLTGNAGSIGAIAIMALAGRLERAIDEGETAITADGGEIPLEAGLADLAGQVAALATASAPWLTPTPVIPPPESAAEALPATLDSRRQTNPI